MAVGGRKNKDGNRAPKVESDLMAQTSCFNVAQTPGGNVNG